ncbi:OprD family porin [Ventosimonas gracilis]|uniref:OprD family porin n=1 Tax=Ventosimonas gracilis TaxID=1680762 RepID=UPI000ABC304B|nr:OprD family porin [Ventosimonas gracilis]
MNLTDNKAKLLLALPLALVGASGFALANQAQSKGFIEDSTLDFLARNIYWYHNRTDGSVDNREWGQGLRLDYRSGYTQGLVGFALEASGYAAIKLDGGRGYSGRANVLVPDTQGTRDEASSAAANIKMRLSATELKYGNNLRPYNPVFAPADARLVPATATGFWLTSHEIKDLELEAGRFTAAKDFNSTNSSDDFYAPYAQATSKTVEFLGGNYQVNKDFSLSLYSSRYKDIWRSHYTNLNYSVPFNESQSVNFDFNFYKTKDQGQKRAGNIDVKAWSLAAAYRIWGHSITLSHQRVNGDQPLDYLGMGPGTYHDSIYLANAGQVADFNGPGERSWGAAYRLNLQEYGVPGLSLYMRYMRGRHVKDTTGKSNPNYNFYSGHGENHWERDMGFAYTVQEGKAKDLSLQVRYGVHRIGSNALSDSSSDQVRVIINFPFNIF